MNFSTFLIHALFIFVLHLLPCLHILPKCIQLLRSFNYKWMVSQESVDNFAMKTSKRDICCCSFSVERTERDDKKLKLLVIESGIMDWKLLSEALEIETDQIKLRWKKVVYPKMIRQSSKVGGSLKWSVLEDKILNVGYRQAINWQDQGRIFLPQRSLGSIEARWRRVAKNFQVKSTAQNKYLARK